jgi:hypothetical protein
VGRPFINGISALKKKAPCEITKKRWLSIYEADPHRHGTYRYQILEVPTYCLQILVENQVYKPLHLEGQLTLLGTH